MSFLTRLHLCTAAISALLFLPDAEAQEAPSAQSTALQKQIDKVHQQKITAQKQVSLKTAAADVTKKRIAELQQQLKDAQERANQEQQSLEKAIQQEAASAQQLTSLQEQLQRHLEADKLVNAAAAAKSQVAEARQKLLSVSEQMAAVQKQLFEQQQLSKKASSDLKAAQEQLPKTTEELGKVRTTLDVAGRDVESARTAVESARKLVKTRQAALQPEQNRVRQADAALAQVDANIKSLEQSLVAFESAARATDADPNEVNSVIMQSLQKLRSLRERTGALVESARGGLAQAKQQLAESQTALHAAHEAMHQKQNDYAEHSRTHFKLQLQIAGLQNTERLHQKQISDAAAAQEALSAKQKELSAQIATISEEVESRQSAYVERQKLAEAAMEPLGRFISFSEHIAPIFAKRCVACHNTRTASGRLNMDSFAGIVKGGESGVSFEAHDAESSLLWTMVDDGSMPKDADSLTKDEIDIIKTWINVGAPLDAGIETTADLFQVMPEIPQPLPPKTYRVPIPVTATAFSPDGKVLASSGYHEILLWNKENNSLLRRITNVAERVYDLEFSADGTQLAVAAGTPGQLGEVKLFSSSDGTHLETLVRTKDAVFAVSYSPDGKLIAAGGADRVVSVVDVNTADTVQQIEDHADWVMDVNWSPDGKQFVTASRDKTCKVFDLATGRSVITFSGHGDSVYSAAFLQDGQSVVSGGSDRQARIWNVADGKETRKIGGFGADIFRVLVTPENHLLTASADRNAREHNLADGKSIRAFSGHKDWVYTLCYNIGTKMLATGSYDGEIRVWNSEDGSVASSFIAIPQPNAATVAASAE